MIISKSTPIYNDRRHGKPWIARLDFAADPKGKFCWGIWIGQPGEPGDLSIEANPGDIVATGQKDNRQPRNSSPNWAIVLDDGTLEYCDSKIDAIRKARHVEGGVDIWKR